MQIIPEFQELAEQFYQDILEDAANEDEMIQLVLTPFRDEAKRNRLRTFLIAVTDKTISDDKLSKIWWSTSTNVVYDKRFIRNFLIKIKNNL